MATISGKDGKILVGTSDYAELRNWNFTPSSNNPQFGSSSSAGHKKSVAGVKSGTVSFAQVLETVDAIYESVKPGDAVVLLLYEIKDNTAVSPDRFWSVPARIESLAVDVDVDDGGEVTVGVEATTNGAWTYPDGTVST